LRLQEERHLNDSPLLPALRMSGHPYSQELQVAIDAVVEASKLCRRIQSSEDFAEISKQDRSPVTIADFGSQAIVCRTLQRAFPDDPVIAEEDSTVIRSPDQADMAAKIVAEVQYQIPSATAEEVLSWIDQGISRDAAPRTWTLDPIDGTKGFLRKEQYAVALALLIDGVVEVAALACPNLEAQSGSERGFAFFAVRGQGAQFAPLSNPNDRQPVKTSPVHQTSDACFCESVESGHSDHDRSSGIASTLGITRDSVRLDSQAKYAVVARGDAEIYLRLPTRPGYVEKIWDHAAGCLVVEEAGGKVTDIAGKPLNFSLGSTLSENRGVIATNGHLHNTLLAAIKSNGS